MAIYMAKRIIEEVYTYTYVIGKRPDLKPGIDAYLVETGHQELIVEV